MTSSRRGHSRSHSATVLLSRASAAFCNSSPCRERCSSSCYAVRSWHPAWETTPVSPVGGVFHQNDWFSVLFSIFSAQSKVDIEYLNFSFWIRLGFSVLDALQSADFIDWKH